MAENHYGGTIVLPGETEITVEFREREARDAVLELIPRDIRLTVVQLRSAAEELEKKEEHLKFMRAKYRELAWTTFMFADDMGGTNTPPSTPLMSAEGEEEYEEEEEVDDRWIGEILQEEGDRLDSRESDTGNPMSGDSVTELYEHKGRFWVVDGIHCWASDFDTYDEARRCFNGEDNE